MNIKLEQKKAYIAPQMDLLEYGCMAALLQGSSETLPAGEGGVTECEDGDYCDELG